MYSVKNNTNPFACLWTEGINSYVSRRINNGVDIRILTLKICEINS